MRALLSRRSGKRTRGQTARAERSWGTLAADRQAPSFRDVAEDGGGEAANEWARHRHSSTLDLAAQSGLSARMLRGKKNSEKLRANAEWDRKQGSEMDPAIFEKEIFPKLGAVSLMETMRATGLSRTYCGLIRRGVRVPHPRHWETLSNLIGAQTP